MKNNELLFPECKSRTIEDAKLKGCKSTKYTWYNENSEMIATFTVFDWWDGKNICDLEVAEKYRNKGYSYILLDYATKKLNCKCLSVEKSNTLAKKIYDKYGFKVVDQDSKYYYMSINKKREE